MRGLDVVHSLVVCCVKNVHFPDSQLPVSAQRGDWTEIEGCWVLLPPYGRKAEAVIHFLGTAFVGAAPQLAYKSLLEALASRNALVE